MAALFKGNFATMIKVAPQTAIQFAVSLLICFTLWHYVDRLGQTPHRRLLCM